MIISGWDHTETLDNLMRKGGYRGHISEETRMKVNVVRFQSDKVLMSHQVHLGPFSGDRFVVYDVGRLY